jgi:spermidine/putrescine transport system permease protein
MFPFMVLPLYSSIEKLDFSLLEAASDLGASPYKAFCKITLPLTKAGIMSGCILVFVPTLGYFFIPDLMGGSKIILISNLIKNQFLAARNWPLGAAVSVVLIIIMFVLLSLYSKLGGTKDKMEVL